MNYLINIIGICNSYISKEITTAIVAHEPFGGLKLLGVGSKAGGPDYLLQFLEGERKNGWEIQLRRLKNSEYRSQDTGEKYRSLSKSFI